MGVDQQLGAYEPFLSHVSFQFVGVPGTTWLLGEQFDRQCNV
jgi:hypothetical protein